jgi:putative tryptophan/tyrosine transport system substrate-binding protein
LANIHFAEAQQSPKIPRIGWLSPSSAGLAAGAFKKAINARSAWLAVIAGSLEAVNGNKFRMSTRNRLPAIYPHVNFVNSGGLMSYDAEAEAPRRAVLMVDKILNGAKPADLPVEKAAKFDR